MYTGTAQYYDELYSSRDYASMSRQLRSVIDQNHPTAESLLDVACGTGRMLGHIQSHYHVEGLDLDPNLLAIASEKYPTIPFHQGDMVDFQLPNRFDVVTCLFRSIGYSRSLERMRCAIGAMSRHLNPGGVLIVEPFFSPDSFWIDDLRLNVFESPDLKISWMYSSKVENKVGIYEIHYLIGKKAGVEHILERHELGLFSDSEYRTALESAGLKASFDAAGLWGTGLYIGKAA